MEIWAVYDGLQGAEGFCMLMGTVSLQKESCEGSQWGVMWASVLLLYFVIVLGALKLNIFIYSSWYPLWLEIKLHGYTSKSFFPDNV